MGRKGPSLQSSPDIFFFLIQDQPPACPFSLLLAEASWEIAQQRDPNLKLPISFFISVYFSGGVREAIMLLQ